MSFQNASDTILGHFNTEWNNLTPIVFENLVAGISGDYVSIEIDYIDSSQSSLKLVNNEALYRFEGLFSIMIYVIEGSGVEQLNVYRDKIHDIFIQSINKIVIRTIKPYQVGNIKNNKGVSYNKNLISIHFFSDDVK